MKRVACIVLLLLAGACLRAAGEGPEDRFIRIYELIQRADGLAESGNPAAARDAYQEAKDALEKLQSDQPNWNERVVSYRLKYLAGKLEGISAQLSSTTDARAKQIELLNGQVKSLQAQIALLEAKLREALTAQPATAEARELAKAEDRIKELQKENETLRASLAQKEEKKEEKPAKAAETEAIQKAQAALKEANQNLARQAKQIEDLTQDNQKLREQLAKKTSAESKPSERADAAQVRALERERDELRRKVTLLNRQLEDRKRSKGGAQAGQMAEELAIARARLEVYEARRAPYSPEELALMQPGVGKSRTRSVSTSPAREIPAAAATALTQGRRAFDVRRFDEAERKFQQALKFDEDNIEILTDLAAAQLEMDRLDAAEATLKKAVSADPSDGQAMSLLGLLRFKQKKYEEALDTLTRAAQLDPDNPVTQNHLGILLSEKGQRAAAETAFRRAIQLQPEYGEAHCNLALVYALQRPPLPELARWHYQKAMTAGNPRKPELEKLLEPTAGASPAQ